MTGNKRLFFSEMPVPSLSYITGIKKEGKKAINRKKDFCILYSEKPFALAVDFSGWVEIAAIHLSKA